MFYLLEKAVILQYAVTALSGGFNAAYFWNYRSKLQRRRVAALALFLVNAGIAAEGLFFTVFALYQTQYGGWMSSLAPALWLAVRLLLCLGALSVTALILRRLLAKHG